MPVPAYGGANVSLGNAVTTVFPYNFKILDQTHIEVKVDGVVKAINADYTVTGVGNSGGGNVIMTAAPGINAVVQRARKVPYLRTTDYQANGDFKEDTVDTDFDLEEMQVQQLAADIARAFKAPLSVTADQVLSDAVWALKGLGTPYFLGFDGGGTFTLMNSQNVGALVVSAYIQTLLDDANALTARGTLGFPAGTDGYPYVPVSGATAVASLPPALGYNLVGGYLDWTVAGNVLTCAVKTWLGNDPSAAEPVWYAVRDVAPATGTLTYRKLTAALNVTLVNTALAGTVNGVAFRLWAVIFNDAGVDRLALINCLSSVAGAGSGRDVTAIFPLAGWGIGTTVLSDAAADNSQVFYSNAATAAKAYTTVGYATWEAGLAAAGVWSAGPTRKQLFGPGVPLPGQVVGNVQRNDTGAVATGTTIVPLDDTIPQNTEGDQYLTQTVTPSSAANVLGIQCNLNLASSQAGGAAVAVSLYQDAVANALKTNMNLNVTADFSQPIGLGGRVLASTTAPTTFKVRAGSNAAGTTTLNGRIAARLYGGVMNSYLEVNEVMA